jgi:hypothetical protein
MTAKKPAEQESTGVPPRRGAKPPDPYGTAEFTNELIAHFHRARQKALAAAPAPQSRPVKGH